MNKISSEYVTVILPCYNVGRYIANALDSLISQTYDKLIILCIDDGSTDDTYSILIDYSKTDHRIIVEKNIQNRGLIFTLNRLVEMSNTRLIVRMDPDDICVPERIERLVKKQLLSNADVVSSAYEFIDEHAHNYKKPFIRLPQSDIPLKFVSLFNSPISHAPCLYKKDFISRYKYSERWAATEDYDLWVRAIEDNPTIKFANIDDYLYKYRIYSTSESGKKASIQKQNHILIAIRARMSLLSSSKLPDSLYFSKYGQCLDLNVFDSFSRAVEDVYECYDIFKEKYILNAREKLEINKYISRYLVYMVYKLAIYNDKKILGTIKFFMLGIKAFRFKNIFLFFLSNMIPSGLLITKNTLRLKKS